MGGFFYALGQITSENHRLRLFTGRFGGPGGRINLDVVEIQGIYLATGVIRRGDDKVSSAGTVTVCLQAVTGTDVAAVNDNAFSVKLRVLQVLGVWNLLIDTAVGVLAGVAALGFIASVM